MERKSRQTFWTLLDKKKVELFKTTTSRAGKEKVSLVFSVTKHEYFTPTVECRR